jgi:hypothetical protein
MTTRRITWSLIAHAKIELQRQVHLPLAATAGPIAALDAIHIGIDAAVAAPEAEIHIMSVTDCVNLAGVLDGGTLNGETEIVGIVDAIGMTVEIGTGIGIAVVEMIGMSGDDEEGNRISISNIQANSKYLVYKKWKSEVN